MLRRVTQVMRMLLLVLGSALMIWFPVSYFLLVVAALPRFGVTAGHGGFAIQWVRGQPPLYLFNDPEFTITRAPDDEGAPWGILLPGWIKLEGPRFVVAILQIPFWLLAAVCLAWPVTSFLVRRRRRGRGFEVETKAAGDPAADPP